MQQRPKATPAKPPRLKANTGEVATKKQLQFVSPLPRRSPATATRTAIKTRLAEGCSSLMYACQHGDIVQVLAQIRAKPQLLRQRDRSNRNALHYCAAQDLEQTRDLVAAASIAIAAPELLESADEDGFTPLHLAVIQGNLAMVNLLLANKADVNAVDNEGHSVVHWATVCGEIEALRAVLAAGANVAKPDVNGGTPLHYAAQMCGASYDSKLQSNSSKLALEILGILLAHPQTSVDVQDKDGRQPLLWAASAGSAKAVIALVKAGARVESADKDGLTALHCAASRGHTECIDTLISLCGAPTDLIDSNGCTALHYAVTLGHADATARLLDLEADPNRQDRKGRTPAHCGCSKGQFETLKLLKERGANLWLRNAKGDLPLHEAAASGRRELLEWLLNQRPKQVNTTSNDGRSLLHIAAANDYTDMCKLLLDYGGDVNALYRNSRGIVLTPLDCALQRGHRSTAKFLQSHGGQPSSKLRLAARRGNPFHEGTVADPVRPLKYVEKEEVHDLRSSKKYVVYLKRTDSDGAAADDVGQDEGEENDCSCTEQTYRKEQRLEHICRRHKRRQLRRRTNSCGENKHEKCGDICRSKSNIEIRRRKSRERYASTSDGDNDEDDEDSCENCCYHKRQKQRVVQRKRTVSTRRSKELADSEDEQSPKPVEESPKQLPIMPEQPQAESKSQTPLKEGTFIKSPPQSAKGEKPTDAEPDTLKVAESHALELTDEELEAAKSVVTQVDVHHDAELHSKSSEELPPAQAKPEAKQELSEEDTKLLSNEVEQMIKIAATALSSESKSSTEEATEKEKSESEEQMNAENESKVSSNANLAHMETAEAAAAVTPTTPPPAPPPAAVAAAAAQPKAEQPQPAAVLPPGPPAEAAAAAEKPEQPPAEPKSETEATRSPGPTPSKPQTEPKNSQQKPKAAQIQPQPHSQTPPQPQPRPQSQQQQQQQQQQQPQREQESRRSFTLLPSDSAEDEPGRTDIPPAAAAVVVDEPERKSSFTVLKSDESMGELEELPRPKDIDFSSNSQVFQVVHDGNVSSKLPSASELDKADYDYEEYDDGDDYEDENGIDPEHDSALRRFLSSGHRQGVAGEAAEVGVTSDVTAAAGVYDGLANGRKRRLKKRVRSGAKSRSNWKLAQETRDSNVALATTSKDQDSGFEPSPRAERTKIPTPRSSHTAMPRRPIYATLDGRSCSSRLENRKPGDKGACDMGAVTRSIQRNIRRYYMERKIFQHLLELKSLQIRSNKLNESVLVKRAVDDYHKSCVLLGGETGTRLRRYNFSEYTFKNFELFLYETLKGLQKPGTNNFQNINEVYEEAERRLSPDYNAYEKALQCTTKTHRCLHAAHAYTGIPCAAYIPMMNHHTMPKFGFGPYKKAGSVSSFYLPKILTSGRASSGRTDVGVGVDIGVGIGSGAGKCNHKVALELSHGKSKQLISLPADKLDSNKRYYVTFTVKDSPGQQNQQHHQQQRQSSSLANAGGDASGK
ncbi:ankycorbin [Drosophila innubila]|uniref:ankycorbin n=1 Tax=Drosophila innubila TaxID=198719 RepID=UPI00148D3429|nr:ankycorbin [Drosophila innubila]